VEDENGEEVKQKRKARRSKEQMDKDKADEDAERQRLTALFECGDTTFTTLGVIDVNLQPKGTRGRKKGKRLETRGENQKDEKVVTAADENNSSPLPVMIPHSPRAKKQLLYEVKEGEGKEKREDTIAVKKRRGRSKRLVQSLDNDKENRDPSALDGDTRVVDGSTAVVVVERRVLQAVVLNRRVNVKLRMV